MLVVAGAGKSRRLILALEADGETLTQIVA